MPLHDLHGSNQRLHVQWADKREALSGTVSVSVSGKDAGPDEGDDKARSLASRERPDVTPCISVLEQALPLHPAERHLYSERFDCESEENFEWRDDARSCSSESTCSSGTCNDGDGATSSSKIFGGREARGTNSPGSRLYDNADDDTSGVAPVHASSSVLSPIFGSVRDCRRALEASAPIPSATALFHIATTKEQGAYAYERRLEQLSSPPPSGSPEMISTDTSPYLEARRSMYATSCAFAPSDLSPEPFAAFRAKNSSNIHVPSLRYLHHSSTAVHEPRARCGCRGLTVRVDSGPLGLSLEASYRMEQGFVLKQAWSDRVVDRGTFTHSVHVQKLPGKRDGGHIGALDLGLEGRSSSSGLVKVRTVSIDGKGGMTTSESSGVSNTLAEPPHPRRPGVLFTKNAHRNALAGVLEVEEGDILVRVNDVQVTKTSFADVVKLLNEADRPTRLTFVRHACGRRFVGRERGGGGGYCSTSAAATQQRPRCRNGCGGGWVGCCGKWGMLECGCDQQTRAASIEPQASNYSPQKSNTRYRQVEAESDGCPVAMLLRSRRQLRSGGIEQWHEVVASRGQLWQRILKTLPPDSCSDRAKIRKLAGVSRCLDGHAVPGMTGISKLKLTSNYQRLVSGKNKTRSGRGVTGGCSSKGKRALAARVWKDVNRTMSARRPGSRPGYFSASHFGGGGHVCPAHFAGRSKHAVFRVAYATASTVQFVSGISYMAALMLVKEPVESMAYATLVTLLQERMIQALFPLGDVDLLDAYHLCGGRVVTFRRERDAARSPAVSQGAATRRADDDQCYPCLGQGYHGAEQGGVSVDGVSFDPLSDDDAAAAAVWGPDGVDVAAGPEMGEPEEEPTQQVVISEMLPRLVRAFGKALRRRLPTLHTHLCKQAIPMSFLCAEWFTTAYARNTPLPLALCAFDLFLVRFDDAIIRLGLAILEVLAPALKKMNGLEILLQYGGLAVNVCYEEVLRCALATQPRQAPVLHESTGDISFGTEKRTMISCALC